MIYENLTLDDITQLEFQCGKRATKYIDQLLTEVKELTERIEALENGSATEQEASE